MINETLYVVTDKHSLYPIRVLKHKPMNRITRIYAKIDLSPNEELTSHIIDFHSDHSMSFTFENNVNENQWIFDNKKEALSFALNQIGQELKGIEQQKKELNELQALYQK